MGTLTLIYDHHTPLLPEKLTGLQHQYHEVITSNLHGRLVLGVNLLVASGYPGQTVENFYPSNLNEVVGMCIPSYASVTFTYRFARKGAH